VTLAPSVSGRRAQVPRVASAKAQKRRIACCLVDPDLLSFLRSDVKKVIHVDLYHTVWVRSVRWRQV
jgi:hypothetical protein